VRFRLDGEQCGALLHECAVGMADFLDKTLHVRNEIDRVDCRRVAGRLEIASDRLLNRGDDVEILGGGVSSPRAATPALAENTRVTQANAPWVMSKQLAHARCLEAGWRGPLFQREQRVPGRQAVRARVRGAGASKRRSFIRPLRRIRRRTGWDCRIRSSTSPPIPRVRWRRCSTRTSSPGRRASKCILSHAGGVIPYLAGRFIRANLIS
jgi:hypothetical protein